MQWYNVGPNPDTPLRVGCFSGCLAIYYGDSVSISSIINGVRNYFKKGVFAFAGHGQTCTPGESVPEGSTGTVDIPVAHCAENQIEGLIDGKLNCWNIPSGSTSPELVNPDATPIVKASTTTNTSTVGDTTITTTTTTNSTGGTTTIVESCTAGNCSSTTSESGRDQTEDPESPGVGADTGDLYTGETGKSFANSIGTFKTAFAATPLYSQATGFFSMAGLSPGACSGMVADFSILGNAIVLDATSIFCGPIMQEMMGYLHIGLLLIFSAIAFAIAFL